MGGGVGRRRSEKEEEAQRGDEDGEASRGRTRKSGPGATSEEVGTFAAGGLSLSKVKDGEGATVAERRGDSSSSGARPSGGWGALALMMNVFFSRWLRCGCAVGAGVFLWGGALRAADDPGLTASDILRAVREGQGSRHEALDGRLRNDETGDKYPFRLVADGATVRYEFAGKPPTTVQVRYDQDNSQLEESAGGSTEKLTPGNFDKNILGTDMTYEDLALRFLYWSRATLVGSDAIELRSAWKLRVDAPNRKTEYSSVNLWVDKESGALLQAEAYNWDSPSKVIKRFIVTSGQKLEGKWYLKVRRIESVNPANGSQNSRTYLNITGLAK